MRLGNKRSHVIPIGKTFGKLTILSRTMTPSNRCHVRCKCSCGKKKTFRLASLKSGNTTSCGCANQERIDALRGAIKPNQKQQHEVCALYKFGHSLSEVSEKAALSVTTVQKILKAAGINSRKCGIAPGIGAVQEWDDTSILDFKHNWDPLDSTVKGTVSETHVKIRLIELGFDVWEPYTQNHRTDLIAIKDRVISKIQVKSATYDAKTKSF